VARREARRHLGGSGVRLLDASDSGGVALSEGGRPPQEMGTRARRNSAGNQAGGLEMELMRSGYQFLLQLFFRSSHATS
jgi:hypothetical protein